MMRRKANNYFVAIAIATLLTAGVAGSMPSLAATLAGADELLLQGKYKEAEENYRELVGEDATGDAYAGLVVSLAKQSWPAKILQAEKLLKEAKGKFSDNPNLIAAGGYVSFVHSKSVASPAKRDLYLDASATLCQRAIDKNINLVLAYQTLGLVRMAQDDFEAAVPPLRKAADLAENCVNLTMLAQALLKLDPKDKTAEELIEKALKLKADYGPAHLQKAVILTSNGKNEEAFMELHNIPDSQRNSEWHTVEGNVLRHQGDGPSALQSWNKANMEDPRNPEPYRQKADYYAIRGDGQLAIAEYHNALEILPNDFSLRDALADLALREDKVDVAEAEYKTILEAKPDDPKALLGLARVGFRKYRKEGAYPPDFSQLMDKLTAVITEQSVTKSISGQVVENGARNLQERIESSEAEKAIAQNRFRDADKIFYGQIEKHRDDPYALINIGDSAYMEGAYKAADKAYAAAKEMSEVSTRAEQGMSKIVNQRNEAARHVKLGDAMLKIPEAAIDHYKQALNADPQSAAAYYGLFDVYAKTDKQDPTQAIDYANRFLESSEDNNPLRKEVEGTLAKLKKRENTGKGK
ncbi:MAG: tetratricopeptide repeat protein [Cyanobacteria bacterium REEB67]|nr:tetratricopeptide repeat protein [Cyanobacteria bacterium REEB67]